MSAPALRFKEFTGAWIKREIGDDIEFLSGYPFDGADIKEACDGIRLMRGANISEGFIRHSVDIDRFYSGDMKPLTKYLLAENDLVIGMDGSKVGKNSALVKRTDVNSLLVQRVARLRAKPKASIEFIYHHVNSNKFHAYVDKVNTSSGIPHISAKQIKEFEVYFPCQAEQTKIANFLTAVDEKLAQLTRKHDLLTQYKKGVMQQIFSQELRFKDDDGLEFAEWKEHELGDLCSTFKSGLGITSEKINEQGEYPVFGGNGLRGYSDSYTHDGFYVLIGRQGALCGNINRSRGKAYISEHAIAVCANESADTQWLAYRLDYMKLNRLSESSAQPGLSVNKIVKIKLHAPSKAEQTKIANFLTSIDDKITATQTQLAAVKQYKQGLLQQMFV